jgi:hypothetical protein
VTAAGISFDRTPSGAIRAPAGRFRVCAWHIDRDERPACFMDVGSLEAATFVCSHLAECTGQWNVDHAAVFDDAGTSVGP